MHVPNPASYLAGRAGVVAATGFIVVATFQLLLAIGVPWGRAAWGGGQATLVPELRVASAVSMTVFIGAAVIVLGRVGYWGRRFSGVFRVGTWVLAVVMTLGAVMNLASSSAWERFIWAPIALLLAVSSFMVARGADEARTRIASDR